MKELLENKRVLNLLKGYANVTLKITPKDFFNSEITTVQKLTEQEITELKSQTTQYGTIKEYGEVKDNCVLSFFKNNDFIYFLWKNKGKNEDGLVFLNELGRKESNMSQSYRFGFAEENGDITLLFNGDYVALSRTDAIDIFPMVQDWVKNNFYGKATAFTEKMQ